MRVLHIISSIDPRTGGTIATVVGLSQAQASQGQAVTVASTWKQGDDLSIAQSLRASGVSVTLIGPTCTALGWHKDLKSTIESLVANSDVVHVHALWEEIQHQAARACQRLGKPYVLIPHGMLDPWSLAQRRLKKYLYMSWRLRRNLNCASALHYTTAIEHDLTLPLRLTPPAIIEPPGLDLGEFQTLPPKGVFRARFPEVADKRIVLFLSRLHPKKGLDLLIPAFARAKLDQTMLVIAGPDTDGYRATLEALIDTHGLRGSVIFTGMLHGPERIAALVDADLFALTSYQENFGIAVTESLAAGTPVMISDQVNIHREVAADGLGVVVAANIDAIAAALVQWMNDATLRESAAGKARAHATERYDWQRIAERWKGHYQRLIAGYSAPAYVP